MRLPALFRTTAFRLTLLFLALFAAAASAFLAYIYVATAGEATRRTEQDIVREIRSLEAAYDRAGLDGLNVSLIERAAAERPFLYLLLAPDGKRISGSIEESPVDGFAGKPTWVSFQVTDLDAQLRQVRHPARGLQERLPNGEVLFVGADVGQDQDVGRRVRQGHEGRPRDHASGPQQSVAIGRQHPDPSRLDRGHPRHQRRIAPGEGLPEEGVDAFDVQLRLKRGHAAFWLT